MFGVDSIGNSVDYAANRKKAKGVTAFPHLMEQIDCGNQRNSLDCYKKVSLNYSRNLKSVRKMMNSNMH